MTDRQKWEYCSLTRKTANYFVNELNDLGKIGWELMSVIYHEEVKSTGTFMAWTGFLKRPYTHESETARAAEHPAELQSAQRFETAELDDAETEFKFQETEEETKVPAASAETPSPEAGSDDDEEFKLLDP